MRQKKSFPLRTIILFLVILAAVGYFGVKGYINSLTSPVDPNGKSVSFVVQKGEAASSIADRLEQVNLIKSALMFKYLYKKTPDANIQAGDFRLSSAMSVQEIIKALQTGSEDKGVTLLEGWRDEEIAKKLNQDLGINPQDFLKIAKEGYMFPDTYFFSPKADSGTIAQTLEDTFNKKYTDDLKQKVIKNGLTADQGVILASIVEREGRSDGVRTQIAGILLKRIKIGMALNADATVQYAKDSQTYKANGGKLDKFWLPIYQEDYQGVVSAYNTYLHAGLPPAPICNPSLSSLTAVANADSNTPYLYYYHDAEGNSYYAKTLEEHNANVANHR